MNILDDSDSEINFSINQDYAKKYEKWRQGEELQKLKDKYGDDTNSELSTSEEEDEDGKEFTEEMEKDFLKTLSSLKEKNPKIYDKSIKFFKDNTENVQKEKKKTDKFYSVGSYQRKMLLESGGKFSDEEDNNKSEKEITYVEQEKALKNSFKEALKDSDSDNDHDGWKGLFKKRVKSNKELKSEEDDYKLWLAGEKKKLKNKEEESELKGLHDFWTDPSLDKGEQFLRDYILNKRFLEKNDQNEIPSYEEVLHDSDSSLSADENTLEKQEEFERKYNFRYEEPDQEFIKRFPRTLEQSMRKKDERRKKHREKIKARKESEKVKKLEELKRLKALKKKEIMDKIKKLQEITGNEEIGFQSKDLEGDFNPDEHDKRMSELFNNHYYDTCADEEKPEYPELDEELEIENWDEWNGKANTEELHCEDPGFNMDCDYVPSNKNVLQNDLIQSSRKNKKRRQSKFATAVAREKPLFDPKNKTFEKYVDEYYSLDYEDLIGDLPCRFRYRKVIPNDFGLSVEEILAAPDKELNSWVSIKKIMQRRPENVELYDVQAYKSKGKNFNKKKKCLPSLFKTEEEKTKDSIEQLQANSRKRKYNSFNDSEMNATSNSSTFSNNTNAGVTNKKLKHNYQKTCADFESKKSSQSLNKIQNRKLNSLHKERESNEDDVIHEMTDARLRSYGINPKKMRNKLKFGSKK